MVDIPIMWVLRDPAGRIVRWAGARSTRKQMMAEAVLGCISATDYQRLDTDSKRWAIAYKRGYRLVQAEVEATA